MSAPEARICYERAESLCNSLNQPEVLHTALMGQWYYSLLTDKLRAATLPIAKRIYSLAQQQNDPRMMLGACEALAVTFYYLGEFETARQYAKSGIEISRSTGVRPFAHELIDPGVGCLMWWSLCEWHLGEIATCKTAMAESIALAKERNDMAGLGMALYCSGMLAHFEGNAAEVESVGSDLIELCTRQAFASWLPGGVILRGWARSVSGNTVEGISCIEDGIRDYQATGAMLRLAYFLAVKAEALHLAGRNHEALETITAAEVLTERSEVRWWCAEMQRLRGVFLAATGADEALVDASFSEAIRIAKAQKSVSLEQRAKGTYAEYRRQKANAAGEREFRPSLL
jgi:tetratricopeptide (TPR) repeat protein